MTIAISVYRAAASALLLSSAGLALAAFPAASAPDRLAGLILSAERGDIAPMERALPGLIDPALRSLAEIEMGASRLDGPMVRKALARFLATHDNNPVHLSAAWAAVSDTAFAEADYSEARDASRHWLDALARSEDPSKRDEAAQLHAMATLLAGTPRMTIEGTPSSVATFRDKGGLVRASLSLNGASQDAVLDTGANLSVLSASAAVRLHVRLIDGTASVGSASRAEVPVRIGVADEIRLAGFRLRQVPFLVVDDAQLEMPLPGGYKIDAIIGFPVFRAIGRVRFSEGRFAAGAPASATRSARLYARGSDLFVDAKVNGVRVALHLDSGSTASELSSAFSAANPSISKGAPVSMLRNAGAGGATSHAAMQWKPAAIALGDQSVCLKSISVAVGDSPDVSTATYGTLGQDVLRRARSFTIDFGSMRFQLGAPAKEALPPCR